MLFTFLLLNIEDYMLPCFSKKIYGIDCPGCGLQRSLAFLFQGDFAAAWDIYPAIFTIIPLLLIYILSLIVSIKYVNKIIMFFGISSAGLILINFILKFI